MCCRAHLHQLRSWLGQCRGPTLDPVPTQAIVCSLGPGGTRGGKSVFLGREGGTQRGFDQRGAVLVAAALPYPNPTPKLGSLT